MITNTSAVASTTMSTKVAANSSPLAQDDYDFGPESNYAIAKEITCSSEKARKLFARGYCFLLNYNHEEAVACFQKCAEEDPECAMAWWGVAYALSPSYNFPPGLGSGYDAIQKAMGLLDGKTELEADLIKALATRHSAEARDAADPTQLNMGNDPTLGPKYCEAIAQVHKKYPENADVLAFYVEGLMNLKPWTLWTKDAASGEVTATDGNTTLLVNLMEQHFRKFGYKHPGLCHLYCHAMELSPYPEKALAAANALRALMPDAGHLVHMPSHIDAWVGQWKEAIDCNMNGVCADDKYVRQSGKESCFYKFYRMHNHHFVVWCAMFEGRYKRAMELARKMEMANPAGKNGVEFMLAGVIPLGSVFLEAFLTMPWHVMVRFGRWDDILAEPLRTDKKVFAGAIATQHYARGVAYASKGMVKEAEEEQALFLEALENSALAGRVLHNNKMYQDPSDGPSLLAVSAVVLEAEIEYRKQFLAKSEGKDGVDFTKAFDLLRKAVKLDLGLAYDEPWGQMQPTRHILGALLLEQGHIDEAEEVYRADIKHWKDNMWGLLGLKLCLQARVDTGDTCPVVEKELEEVSALYVERSKRADIVPAKTCFCAQNSLDTCRTKGSSCCGANPAA